MSLPGRPVRYAVYCPHPIDGRTLSRVVKLPGQGHTGEGQSRDSNRGCFTSDPEILISFAKRTPFFVVIKLFSRWGWGWEEIHGILSERMRNGPPQRDVGRFALASGGGGITAEPQSRRHLMGRGRAHVAESIWRDLTVLDPQAFSLHHLRAVLIGIGEEKTFRHFLSTGTRVWGCRAQAVRLGNEGAITVNLERSVA